MKHFSALGILAAALLLVAAVAHAEVAYTVRDADLRAGPSIEYPLIATLPAGYELTVLGCLNDFTWCDVLAGADRGWIYAGNINYQYADNYVPILDYGPELGIGITGFVIGDYWWAHYRDRSWYRDRDRWMNHPPDHRHERHHDGSHERHHPVSSGTPVEQRHPHSGSNSIVQPLSQPVTQPRFRIVTMPLEHPVVPSETQPLVQPLTQPVVPPETQPFVQPLTQLVVPSETQPLVQPLMHPVVPTETQPLIQPLPHPMVRTRSRPLVQPLNHSVVQPQSQPLVQPLTNPVVQPIPDNTPNATAPEHRREGRWASDRPSSNRHETDQQTNQSSRHPYQSEYRFNR